MFISYLTISDHISDHMLSTWIISDMIISDHTWSLIWLYVIRSDMVIFEISDLVWLARTVLILSYLIWSDHISSDHVISYLIIYYLVILNMIRIDYIRYIWSDIWSDTIRSDIICSDQIISNHIRYPISSDQSKIDQISSCYIISYQITKQIFAISDQICHFRLKIRYYHMRFHDMRSDQIRSVWMRWKQTRFDLMIIWSKVSLQCVYM